MLGLTITSDIDRLTRSLNELERRQLPFAISRTLNSTAFDIRKQIVERTYRRSFDVRDSRFINTALRVDKSTKRRLVVRVYDRLERDFLQRQARGGTKRARGTNVAVPTDAVAAKRGARGVPKSLRPRAVLDKPKGFVRTIGGKKIIMRRVGTGKRQRVEPLFVLTTTARIPKRFPFYEVAARVVRLRLSFHFHREFKNAVRTAKR